MICVHCGKEIQDNAAFCPYCGTAATTPAAETPSPAATESLTYTPDTTDVLKNGDTVTLTVRSYQDDFR